MTEQSLEDDCVSVALNTRQYTQFSAESDQLRLWGASKAIAPRHSTNRVLLVVVLF